MKTLEEKNITILERSRPPVGGFPSAPSTPHSMRDLEVGELCKGRDSRLPELIVSKLHSLDTTDFIERRVARKARFFLSLIRDSMSGRYPHLSMVAFAEILLAMHHFIEVHDEIPDTHDGGFVDDLRKLTKVRNDNSNEIEAYERWRRAS